MGELCQVLFTYASILLSPQVLDMSPRTEVLDMEVRTSIYDIKRFERCGHVFSIEKMERSTQYKNGD